MSTRAPRGTTRSAVNVAWVRQRLSAYAASKRRQMLQATKRPTASLFKSSPILATAHDILPDLKRQKGQVELDSAPILVLVERWGLPRAISIGPPDEIHEKTSARTCYSQTNAIAARRAYRRSASSAVAAVELGGLIKDTAEHQHHAYESS
ncbi:hypothetical protein BDN72DRAFT_295824 [Pluteus cervinus]|uniref:Uncharacterized protein n=1 Tax=Pluteus cervinus TaxID=181527 RepID=A0ACD3B505_9AGAR|nr:hypothetical protein BDN72DRAFT_295824 [Pluteus cervinus]